MVENSQINYLFKLFLLGAAQHVEFPRAEIHKKYILNEVQPLWLSPKKYGNIYNIFGI